MINKIKEISILDAIDMYGEDNCQKILSSFYCPLNHGNQSFLVGYYTLTNKFLSLSDTKLSKTIQRKILKFAQFEHNSKQFFMPIPLIAQLGKNDKYSEFISGEQLLALACDRVKQAQKIIGGKMVYIECASNPKLHSFYSTNGFTEFGQREVNDNLPLVQMVKYF